MSVNLTTLATSIAKHLDESHGLLKSNAWREHAESLAFVGRHTEAIEAVDTAAGILEIAGSPAFDLARLALTRANVLIQVRRGLTAIFQVRDAASVFLRLGEKQQFVNARLIESTILYQSGRAAEALAVWRDLERDLGGQTEEGSAAARGVMFNMIAGCFRLLGDYEAARGYYRRAQSNFIECGDEAHAIKSRWGIAKVLMCEGDLLGAAAELRRVAARFAALSMRLDEALASSCPGMPVLACEVSDVGV